MNRSNRMKKKWSDPEYRKRQVAAMKRAWKGDPDRKAKASLFMMGDKGDRIREKINGRNKAGS